MKRYFPEEADADENPRIESEKFPDFPEQFDNPLTILSCRQLKRQIKSDEKFFSISARLSINPN